ncbi:MAG: MBL fold metallo-hydrolase [Gemmataceae bacterium]
MSRTPPVDAVAVRMYRHGFGDCFLLRFFAADKPVFAVLVDCGIKLNTKSKAVPIEAVVDDLRKTLAPAGGGRPRIDVLVATHEHWDHVAFFHPTRSPVTFDDFDVGRVWLAWTEDPDDDEAKVINARLRDGAAALQVAAGKLGPAAAADAARFQGLALRGRALSARKRFVADVGGVLGFYGLAAAKPKDKAKPKKPGKATSESGIRYKPDGKISVDTEEAMTNVVALGAKGGVTYHQPGTTVDPRELPAGVSVYVLGPPRSSKINTSDPSEKNPETYLAIDHTGLTGFVDGLLEMGRKGGTPAPDRRGPFAPGVGITADAAEAHPYLKRYFDPKDAYRRVDNSWLDAVGPFALQLDGAVNNTSLVLAFEIEATGSVLLFPGDAQVGSWLAWHDMTWTVRRDGRTETVTAEKLLNNTVLYKVSHHGSHNATLRAKGLEMMTHPELVALIPEKEKSYSGILYEPLLDGLRERCKGRVVVSADKDYPPEEIERTRPPELSKAEWEAFKKNLTVGKLWVEYTVR